MLQNIAYILNIINTLLNIVHMIGKWIWLALVHYPVTLTLILLFRLPRLDEPGFPLFEFIIILMLFTHFYRKYAKRLNDNKQHSPIINIENKNMVMMRYKK